MSSKSNLCATRIKTSDPDRAPLSRAATYALGGDLKVHRLGYGNMQLTGAGVWGDPPDREQALRVLRRAVELGVELIDTADSYGPGVAEDLIAEALYPYVCNLVIATKAGLVRTAPGEWHPLGRPEYLRQQCEMSLRRLRLERIDLFQLHRIDPQVALEDQLGELQALQQEGKIRHIGLSEVRLDQIESARKLVTVACVQNRYSLADRGSDAELDYCQERNLAFIPWFPLANGQLAGAAGVLAKVAMTLGATVAQVALAWLLDRSPNVLPIPGTSSISHLEENVAAASIKLSRQHLRLLQGLV
ncbi:MAG: aldo/keto reductase [Candidatus Dormibacteria bacterium]